MTAMKWQASFSFRDLEASVGFPVPLSNQAEGAVDKAFWTIFRLNKDQILFISMKKREIFIVWTG